MAVTPITVSPSLASVLNAAGDRNDVDFNYLLQTAMRESALDPNAKAASSSATGLFQFLDSTWLQVMKSEGPRLGYQKYADAITQASDGEYVIKDPKVRAEVLKLRENPQVAADMAAAFTKSNGDFLKAKFGRMPSPGELYIAHFLGPQGAVKMFSAGLKDPDQIAAKLFPREASANRPIFYDHGQPRTIREVYRALIAQHEGPATLHAGYAVQQLASSSAPQPMDAGRRPGQPVPLAPLPYTAASLGRRRATQRLLRRRAASGERRPARYRQQPSGHGGCKWRARNPLAHRTGEHVVCDAVQHRAERQRRLPGGARRTGRQRPFLAALRAAIARLIGVGRDCRFG